MDVNRCKNKTLNILCIYWWCFFFNIVKSGSIKLKNQSLILSSQLQFYAWFVRKYQTKMLKTSIFEDEMMKYAQHYVYIIKSMRKGIFAGYRKPKSWWIPFKPDKIGSILKIFANKNWANLHRLWYKTTVQRKNLHLFSQSLISWNFKREEKTS